MRPPAVDYRGLRRNNINSSEFAHLKFLLSWAGYILLFLLTEKLIPAENCRTVHCRLDNAVPFCEWFIIPYVSWYVLIIASLGYFLLYNVDSFKRLQTYIIITQIVAITIYILFPNKQELRPEVFPRDNVLTKMTGLIYSVDTSTGVCPSLHVAFSMGIASTWLREKSVPAWVRAAIAIWCGVICISVAFVKQHSVVDIFAAIPMCLFAEWFVFSRKKNTKGKNENLLHISFFYLRK